MKKKPTRRPTPAPSGNAIKTPRPAAGQPAAGLWGRLTRFRVPGLVLLYVLLALNFVRLPKMAANMTHDLGSQMSFEFYARDKYQFGVDVIQNVGPYGYLSYPYDYSGILPVQKLVFGIVFGLTLAWYALDARRYFFSMTGKVIWFLALFLALVPSLEELDPVSDLFILLAGYHLLLCDREGWGTFASDAVLCVLLGLLALMKSTNLMLVFLLVILIVVERIRTRRLLDLACNIGCIGLTMWLLWVLAGQKVSNAAAFMRGAMAFSKGYNEALSNAGKPELVWLGIAVIIFFTVINVLRLRRFRDYWRRYPTIVFEAACVFVVWKHGYIRAGHEFYFWIFILQAAPLLFMAHEAPLRDNHSLAGAALAGGRSSLLRVNVSMYHLGASLMTLSFICAIWACHIENGNESYSSYATPWNAFNSPLRRMVSNLWELADWPAHLSALKASLAQNRAAAALPKVKEAVGNATIDMFGFLPGLILLNDLHYKPRPVPINFAATTQMLMERNAEFYRNDATAPEYILANIGQIDARFPPQDDAIALPEVLERYRPVLTDHGFILLKRTPDRPALERTLLGSTTIRWGQSVPLPPTGTNFLWCTADVKFTLLGKARSALFQPAQLFIALDSPDRGLRPTRLLQSGASAGFLMRPLILNGVDFLAAYGMRAEPVSSRTPSFDTVRFLISADDQAFFEPDITLSFWSLVPKE